jgi:hypothetical protein
MGTRFKVSTIIIKPGPHGPVDATFYFDLICYIMHLLHECHVFALRMSYAANVQHLHRICMVFMQARFCFRCPHLIHVMHVPKDVTLATSVYPHLGSSNSNCPGIDRWNKV